MESRIVLICGVLALLARVGMVLWAVGLVRAKNSAGMILRQVIDFCITIVAVWAVGAAIMAQSGKSGFAQFFSFDSHMLFGGSSGPNARNSFYLFYWVCVITLGTGILPGVLAERTKFAASGWGSLLLAAVCIPVVGHWVGAGGWLGANGYHDFAGATMLHLAGGLFAAVGAVVVGARQGKYNTDGSSNAIPGHSVPLATIGGFVILAGWIPYLLGAGMPVITPLVKVTTVSDYMLARIGLNVLLAGAGGAMAGLFFSYFRYTKADVYLTFAGFLGGLVAITAGADILPGWGALLLGAAAGVLVPWLTIQLDLRARLDDPTGAVAVHAGGAILGLLVTPFCWSATLSSTLTLFLIAVLGILATSLFILVVAFLYFTILKRRRSLRSKEADEFDGLDLAEHDIGAYPDFQQNTIKSYHLREA